MVGWSWTDESLTKCKIQIQVIFRIGKSICHEHNHDKVCFFFCFFFTFGMYKLNSSGPSIDSWGIPHTMPKILDIKLMSQLVCINQQSANGQSCHEFYLIFFKVRHIRDKEVKFISERICTSQLQETNICLSHLLKSCSSQHVQTCNYFHLTH